MKSLLMTLLLGVVLGPLTLAKNIPPTPLAPITPLMDHYFSLQKSLSQDELKAIKPIAEKMKESVQKQLEAPGSEAEKLELKQVLVSVEDFIQCPAGDSYTKEIRIRFGKISKELVTHFKVHKEETSSYQLFFCPMFPQGYAFWIQPKNESLANPYWGKEMLTCGVRRPW